MLPGERPPRQHVAPVQLLDDPAYEVPEREGVSRSGGWREAPDGPHLRSIANLELIHAVAERQIPLVHPGGDHLDPVGMAGGQLTEHFRERAIDESQYERFVDFD